MHEGDRETEPWLVEGRHHVDHMTWDRHFEGSSSLSPISDSRILLISIL